MYRSVPIVIILLTDIIPNGKILPRCKGVACFCYGKSLVWLNLVFLCSLLRKSKHGIRFFVSFSILQLFTDCIGVNIREIITALKA